MDSPFSTMLGPILVLWIGALVLYVLDRFFEPRQDRGVAEVTALVLALGLALNARSQVDVPIVFGDRPGTSPTLALQVDGYPVEEFPVYRYVENDFRIESHNA